MIFNQDGGEMKSLDDHKLKCVDDFVYLGSWINSCKKDVDVRINKAWQHYESWSLSGNQHFQ